jgi:hypothetical protein
MLMLELRNDFEIGTVLFLIYYRPIFDFFGL